MPTVAGVFALGGALLTLLFGYVREKRQHDARWEKDLRELARDFISTSRAALRAIVPVERSTPATDFEVARALNAVTANYTEISLLAPQKVLTSAWTVVTTLREFKAAVQQELEVSALERLGDVHVQAVRNFTGSVRGALGLPDVDLPDRGPFKLRASRSRAGDLDRRPGAQ